MKLGLLIGVLAAFLLHAAFILFGGLLFPAPKKDGNSIQQVDLLNDVDAPDKDKPVELKEEKKELETETEQPPDAAEITSALDAPPTDNTPALEAASLSAIEAALNGGSTGGGDFAESMSFSSGGRIGGTGKAGSMEEKLEEAFSLAEIDQKPRAVFQGAPTYPSEMRGKKLEGVVTVIFVVDASGKVSNPRVEKSSHTAFAGPALNAVKKWKFEPAVRAGQRVACKMRVPIRFPAS